ncbi:RNA-binding protein 34 [Ricinus communis]|uniref:RNA-binding protein 34 n=1 Tax=Ricinus communis TaxID=3988 RepID=UPI00201A8942|nr:RNA-binding protein 34 [Ricinus communis]
MGGKKESKELEAASASINQAGVSTPSNIFKTLFGDVVEQKSALAIFSDSNPFKRKSNEETNSVVEEKVTEIPLEETKKTKKLKSQKSESETDKTQNEKKKKKRKRDDIESEYEAKKYGSPEVSRNAVVVAVGEKRKKAENAEEDMLVSKEGGEGFDDESKLLRTVFVGNLPLKMKKKTLVKEFSQFGEIDSVRIRSVPIVDTKIPRKGAVILKKINDSADSVHAYIVFKTEQSAEASLANNMAVVGGNHIRVDRACPPRKKLKGEATPLYDNKRTLFVGNLPFDVKDEEIYQLFSGIKDLESSIEAVRVIRDSYVGLGRGIAYVLFKTREAVNLALKKRNLNIRDRELRLSHAKKDATSTPSKRKNSFPAETGGTKKLDSRPAEGNRRSNTKASLSYQGLRASKPGTQKKPHPKHNGCVKAKSNTQTGEKRNGKRPAVAARKARVKSKDGSAIKQTGQKRKLDSRTPESSNTKKKTKKFRK